MQRRIGVIGIVIEEREKVNTKLNGILSNFGEIIIGRMGIPAREYQISVISLIVEGTPDEIGAMTGQLGNLPGITLKSALTAKVVNEE
ncbi:MAG: TM1266 family iron-only hydrogenase system putative regulator [Halothermotrichaceae bacterium]